MCILCIWKKLYKESENRGTQNSKKIKGLAQHLILEVENTDPKPGLGQTNVPPEAGDRPGHHPAPSLAWLASTLARQYTERILPSILAPISGYESPSIRKQRVQVFSSQTQEMEIKLRVFKFTK